MTWSAIERTCVSLEIHWDLLPRWRGFDGAHLLDREHASIAEYVVSELRSLGWDTIVEYTFNHFGDRGSVDVLGWHPRLLALLIVEVKTAIVDIQDLSSTLDRKARVVPALLARERGWVPATTGRLLVAKGSRAVRSTIERHPETFASSLPDRTVACRRWLRQPVGRLAGILFVADSRLMAVMRASRRVRSSRRSAAPVSTHDSTRGEGQAGSDSGSPRRLHA